jgi:hypothetical protein
MPVVISPPYGNDQETATDNRVRAFNMLAFFALIFNLAAILLSYVLLIEVDQVGVVATAH